MIGSAIKFLIEIVDQYRKQQLSGKLMFLVNIKYRKIIGLVKTDDNVSINEEKYCYLFIRRFDGSCEYNLQTEAKGGDLKKIGTSKTHHQTNDAKPDE